MQEGSRLFRAAASMWARRADERVCGAPASLPRPLLADSARACDHATVQACQNRRITPTRHALAVTSRLTRARTVASRRLGTHLRSRPSPHVPERWHLAASARTCDYASVHACQNRRSHVRLPSSRRGAQHKRLALSAEHPRRDSNSHLSDFKSPASAGWATGARPSLTVGPPMTGELPGCPRDPGVPQSPLSPRGAALPAAVTARRWAQVTASASAPGSQHLSQHPSARPLRHQSAPASASRSGLRSPRSRPVSRRRGRGSRAPDR